MSSVARLSSCIMCAGAAALAVTGIGVFAFGTPPMTHWVLMAHIAAAPVFALGVVAVALTHAGRSQKNASGVLLWLVLTCGLVVILSGALPMTPLFGTGGEHVLYLTHRYAAIVLAVALVFLPFTHRRPSSQSGNENAPAIGQSASIH